MICYPCTTWVTRALLVFFIASAHGESPDVTLAVPETPEYVVDIRTPVIHDDREFLWFHPRAVAIPTRPGRGVMTVQKHLQVSDYYSGLHVMYTEDSGETWTMPEARPELDWFLEDAETQVSVADVTPGWHGNTGKVMAIGVKVRYRGTQQVYDKPQSFAVTYTVHDPEKGTWTPWRYLEVPDPAGAFYLVSPGCSQWIVEENGDVLLPVYVKAEGVESVTVLRCGFNGETLSYLAHGNMMTAPEEGGVAEPSIVRLGDRYFLTIRNLFKGFVTTSTDGIHFGPMVEWRFDDNTTLGSYNTQQHWLARGGKLYLVYTRTGLNNDHVFRHRAPLMMAEVNPETLQVIRATEHPVINERGATLGNFGVNFVTDRESWITVGEGVWDDAIRARGGKGATIVSRILWKD
jgi:hypothetical protein